MGTAEQRFLAKIDMESGAPCWLWRGCKFEQGYGKFFPSRKRPVKAHRFSWELFNQKQIPQGLVICHSCDNKLCVNPDHLRAATQAFNVREAIERKRWKPNFGVANGRAVLTIHQVNEIRSSGMTQHALATAYRISQSQVGRIVRGESWA